MNAPDCIAARPEESSVIIGILLRTTTNLYSSWKLRDARIERYDWYKEMRHYAIIKGYNTDWIFELFIGIRVKVGLFSIVMNY